MYMCICVINLLHLYGSLLPVCFGQDLLQPPDFLLPYLRPLPGKVCNNSTCLCKTNSTKYVCRKNLNGRNDYIKCFKMATVENGTLTTEMFGWIQFSKQHYFCNNKSF